MNLKWITLKPCMDAHFKNPPENVKHLWNNIPATNQDALILHTIQDGYKVQNVQILNIAILTDYDLAK